MPKKIGVNTRSVEAKAKKDEVKKGKAAAAEKEQEDRQWKDAGEGAKSKAQAKKEEQVLTGFQIVILRRTQCIVRLLCPVHTTIACGSSYMHYPAAKLR